MAAEAVFGHYRLLALLGRGGMGEVWRAHDTRKDREVALKVLGAWLGAEPDYARRFRREAALAARLNSPNIIPIHDYGEFDGRLFIEMPLIDGVDLDELVARQGPLPPARVVGIIEQVADALDVAHEAGLVHRDVKPSNVLVSTRRGRDFVYLIDFGIARSLDSTSISHTGAVVGTLAYMAPERFAGEGDHRGDVYALACVLYAALTGQPPFSAPTGAFPLGFYLDAHRSQDPPCPSRLVPNVPARFDAIIARGMAKQPADRYPSAGDLGIAAHAALSSPPPRRHRLVAPARGEQTETGSSPAVSTLVAAITPTTPRPGPAGLAASSTAPPTRSRRGWPRSWTILFSIGVSLALIAGLVTLLTTQGKIFNSGITEGALTGHTDKVGALTTAQLAGRAVIISGSADGTVRVWDLVTHAPIGQPLTDHSSTVNAVAAAQLDDRPVIVSGNADGTVRVWDLATHGPIGQPLTNPVLEKYRVTTDPGFETYAVTTAQLDGRSVIISGSGGAVQVWDLATHAPIGEPLFGSDPARVGVLPDPVRAVTTAELDGRPVIISGSADGTVRVWDLTTHAPIGQPLANPGDGVHAVAAAQLNSRPVIISGSADGTVRVWDLATHAPIGQPLNNPNPRNLVVAVTTAQLEGRPVIVTGDSDGTVGVWDLATHAPVGQPFDGHTDSVHAVATAQLDGRPVIITGSDDKTVRVWDLTARTR